MQAVLLTDAQLRKTLAAVRSLGSKGVPVSVAETTRWSPAAFSKYCQSSYICPDPAQDSRSYAEWLAETLMDKQIDVLFPMDDYSLKAVMEHPHLFELLHSSILPPMNSYRIAADKASACRLAESAAVPLPRTLYPQSLEELAGMAEQLRYPIVIKPRFSSGSRGIRVVHDLEALHRQYCEIHSRYPFPILQQFIQPGERFDVCLLFDQDGKLKASFVQKELRHYPLERGPSTAQESVTRPDLLELAAMIMSKLPWRGIAELEFMVDPIDGQAKFMEINPRFWNSLQASILSGVDFPWLLYQMALGKSIERCFEYRDGVRCQSLLPGDLLHHIAGRRLRPPLDGADDLLSWKDPMPAVGFIMACLRYLPDPRAWKLMFNR